MSAIAIELTMHNARTTRVWLVWVDHSVLGVWSTRSGAKRAAKLRAKDSLLEVEYHVMGPYVLAGAQ